MNNEEKAVYEALCAANACLIENGDGPPALTEAQMHDLAGPLAEDLEIRGFRFSAQDDK